LCTSKLRNAHGKKRAASPSSREVIPPEKRRGETPAVLGGDPSVWARSAAEIKRGKGGHFFYEE